MTSTTAQGPHVGAANMSSAQACLDVLCGTSVLVGPNEQGLIELLAAKSSQDGGSLEPRELTLLKNLVASLSSVLKGISSAESTEICSYARVAPPGVGKVADWSGQEDVSRVHIKRPRVDGAAMPQQPHVRLASGNSTAAVGGGQHCGVRSVTTTTAKADVLTSPELLVHIMGYLVGGTGKWNSLRTRKVLGRMALVCRTWGEAAQDKVFWEPLAKDLIPRLGDDGEMERKGSYRQYLVQYGCVLLNKYVLDLSSWHNQFQLEFEIVNVRDGFHIFSGDASLICVVEDGWTNLFIADAWGQPFSAASRSTGRYSSYASIREYLEDMSLMDIRVTVHDKSTGRRGLLLNRASLRSEEVLDGGDDEWTVDCEPLSLASICCKSTKLNAVMHFSVVLDIPDEWQNGVELDRHGKEQDTVLPESQKIWNVIHPTLSFMTEDESKVGRLVWAALGY